jgi:alkanesulfonate monooxygenase SsuD/methylene tetrahydromethanopterin reductase-like flavin-dependent oxidoreductase (luciferase family)
VKIGVTLPQFTADPDRFMSGVERVEGMGFDSMWLFDHLWPLGGKRERPILESWTSLGFIAEATTDADIGTLVTRASLRHPAILAKMAATVGSIAPGRLTVALGSGDHLNRPENEAFGAPFFREAERAPQLVSTLETVARYLKTGSVTLHDDFVDIEELPASPRTDVGPRVWLGGRSVEVLEAAGRIADGWNGWGANLETFAADARKVTALAGTRPFEVSWAGQVILADDDAKARERLGDRDPTQFVVGSPETVRTALTSAITAGATHLIVALPDAGDVGAYEHLAASVEPLRTA